MADNASARERALLEWVNSVEGLSDECKAFEDLHDGVLMSEILGMSVPSDIAMEDIEDLPQVDEEKIKNIETVINGLVSFYSDTFNTQDTFEHIDAKEVATRGEGMREGIHALLELILGCVINCSDKVVYIEGLQQLDPATQTEIMHVIQSVMGKYSEGISVGDLDESSIAHTDAATPMTGRQARSRSSSLSNFKSPAYGGPSHQEFKELQDRMFELEEKLQAKTGEAESLASEVQELQQEMQAAAQREKTKDIEKMKLLKTAISQREVEISGGMRDLEGRCAQLEQANALLQRQLQQKELNYKEKMQSQSDEVAVLRSQARRMDKLEAKLKRKDAELKSFAQLREHLEQVEKQNLELEEQNATLVAETSKIIAMKKQLQAYRDKLTAVEIAAADYKLKSASKLADAEDKIHELEQNLQHLENAQSAGHDAGTEPPSPAVSSAWSMSQQSELHSLRQQIVRLKNENAQLKSQSDESVDTLEVDNKQHLVDHLEKQQADLLKENRQLKRRVATLEQGAGAPSTPQPDRSEARAQLKEAIGTYKAQLSAKQKDLEKLTTEKMKMEAYFQNVMNNMTKQKGKFKVAMQSLREQVQTQQATISGLQLAHKREQQLFQSAFYNMGRELAPGLLQEAAANRLRTPGRSSRAQGTPTSGAGTSWLGRKRMELKR